MSVPGIVQSSLDDEQIAAKVSLGGEDVLYVTPTRTLVYRADGLLSDESVDEYPHEAERIAVTEGRRKSTVTLDYGIDGTDQFKVPTKRLHDALHPVIAGVLNGAGVTDSNEQVIQTYQFSELTLVLTSSRVVKHVGEAIWDTDFEQFHFADVTRLDVEEGNVSSQILIEADGRPQRIKTPSDRTREVRERIEQGLLTYHDVGSYAEFERSVVPDDPKSESDDVSYSEDDDDVFGGGVEPLDANPLELNDDGKIMDSPVDDPLGSGEPESVSGSHAGDVAAESASVDRTSDPSASTASPVADEPRAEGTESEESTGFADSGFESASENMDDPVEAQLAALTETVERQNELLERHEKTIERLIAELGRGR